MLIAARPFELLEVQGLERIQVAFVRRAADGLHPSPEQGHQGSRKATHEARVSFQSVQVFIVEFNFHSSSAGFIHYYTKCKD